MKRPFLFSMIAGALLGATVAILPAQENPTPEAGGFRGLVLPWQAEFENLPTEEKKKYAVAIGEASRLYNQKRIIEALNKVAEAQAVFENDPNGYNLKGACHVELRDFDQGRAAFERAYELQKPALEGIEGLGKEERLARLKSINSILFNLAEMDFVTKNWQACHDSFEKLLAQFNPKDEAMTRLLEFKLLLCKLKIGQVEEARKMADKYDYLDDHPFHYYANAALAYFDGKDEEAERWRASARRIFRTPPQVLSSWEDTLIEYGYVKSFYGGDLAVPGSAAPPTDLAAPEGPATP